MDDIDRMLQRLPPPSADVRTNQIEQYVWLKVEKIRMRRQRFTLCVGTIALTLMLSLAIGHFSVSPEAGSVAVLLISDRV
jgi:uracil-DNA glycosylase